MAAGNVMALFATHLVLPLLFCLWLWRGSPTSRTEWLAEAFAYGTYIVFVTLAGSWVQIGLVARYLTPVLLAAVLWRTSRERRALPLRNPEAPRRVRVRQIFFAFMAAVFFLMNLSSLRGYFHPRELAVELEFPLEAGLYGVAQGGSHPLLNRYAVDSERRFAVEFVGLGAWKSQSARLFPDEREDFHIWGAEVVSPCAGVVVGVESGELDSAPGVSPDGAGTDPGRGSSMVGNFVRIRMAGGESGPVEVVLAHLQQGSVSVALGDSVSAGEAVGRVGCSGTAMEPSLLVYAKAASPAGDVPVLARPIRFGGAFLVRNTQFRSQAG